MLIFIKVFHLLENCYFDSKCHFVQWYFGQECSFSKGNLHYTWYKFFGEIEQFFEKGVNLVVNFGKNDTWFYMYFSCQFWNKWQFVLEVSIFFVMWASLVKSKILQKHQFWRIFPFLLQMVTIFKNVSF